MKNIVIIYDDSIDASSRVKTIIGEKSFGNIIIKRKTLFDYFEEIVNKSNINPEIIRISDLNKLDETELKKLDNKIIFHYFSTCPFSNSKEFVLLLKKLKFIKETIKVEGDSIIGMIFPDVELYKEFIDNYKFNKNVDEYVNSSPMKIDGSIDISNYQNLLYFISSGFDARYFNSLQGDNYIVTKKSNDKKKMKMEYTYYWLLPEHMKSWMVMPYDYKEEADYASYTMERLPMTDIAIRWTNGAVDVDEFNNILDKTFYFIKSRDSKKITKEEYIKCANKLYIDKLDDRVKKLISLPEYTQINNFIKNGTRFEDFEDIINLYKKLYNKITKKIEKQKDFKSVIGHGDVFFANMLYSKEINLLRLIDPKGALKEEELWTDPYYDVAKLSHSICGNYDFFNTGSYDISITKDMKLILDVKFNNMQYKLIFKDYLEKNGFDYELVRLYESSLFLSMLPLHIDNPHKVLAFILNAINILEELENV